jgi:AcrR family transcriptional regulator
VTFQRARSPQQRDARRAAILATAASMLTELPVAGLSLNELARRVGLAKSNVLRYFESREAVLLELLETELDGWTAALRVDLSGLDGPAEQRVQQLAERVATSLAARPVLCDLASAQASVLERNVSGELVARHKRALLGHARELSGLVAGALPELGEQGSWQFVLALMTVTGAVWTHSQPPAAALAAYRAEPELEVFRIEFAPALRELLAVLLLGLLVRMGEPTGPGLPAAP